MATILWTDGDGVARLVRRRAVPSQLVVGVASAATTSERQVEATLQARVDAGDTCEDAGVQAAVRPPVPTVPVVHIPRPDLTRYDAVLTGGLHG